MAFRRSIRPPFNSFPQAAAECLDELSDSEYGSNESSRTAKRRRITQFGEDYLEGRPLFILSAGLKGPFGDGWVNPWARSTGAREKSTEGRRRELEAVAILETTSRRLHHQQTVVQSSRTRESARDSHGYFDKQGKPPEASKLQQTWKSSNIQKDRKRSSSSSMSRASSKSSTSDRERLVTSHRSTDNSWLRKDQNKIHSRVINPPKSPSPTPASRPSRSERLDTEQRTVSPVISRPMKPASFTPINGYQHVLANKDRSNAMQGAVLETHSPSSGNTSKRRPGKSKAASTAELSQFPKPVQPASTLQRHGSSNSSTAQSSGTAESQDTSKVARRQRKSKSGQRRHTGNSRSSQDTVRGDESHTLHPSNGSEVQNHEDAPRRSIPTKQSAQHSEGSFLYNSVHDRGTFGTHGWDDGQSGTVESEEITSAQMVPGNSKLSNPVVSLNSATFVQHSHSTQSRRRSLGYGDQLSTQTAVLNAQKLLQEDLATPVRDELLKRSFTNRQDGQAHTIPGPGARPNRISDITAPVSAHKTPNGARLPDLSTQAMVNTITPYSFDTAKKLPPKNRNEAADTTSGVSPLDRHNHHTSPTSINKPAPHSDEQRLPPTHTPEAPTPSPEKYHNHHHEQQQQNQPPDDLTGSTTETKQDGQGGMIAGFDDFDLNQVIADAGSFLHWDIEQDLSRCSGGPAGASASASASASSSVGLQSILRSV